MQAHQLMTIIFIIELIFDDQDNYYVVALVSQYWPLNIRVNQSTPYFSLKVMMRIFAFISNHGDMYGRVKP